MKPLGHKVISASAGSGKTWQLTNRYIELLATGCAPERIAALTFSRKAAGEIFDRITGRLAEAALDAAARRLLPPSGGEGWSAEAVTGLLRQVLESMPRLQIGTLDSFFARTVRAFPLELGISSDFQILDDALFFSERQAALRRVLANGDSEGQRKLLRDFRDAVFGTDEKSATRTLSRLIEAGQQLYVETPGAECWGTPKRIWPDPPVWMAAVEPPDPASIDALLARHPSSALEEAVMLFSSHRPGTAPSLNAMGKRLLEQAAEFAGGVVEVKEGRGTRVFDAADCAVLDRLLGHFLCRMIASHLQSTAGFHRLLARYEADYHARVRCQGRLAFSDLLLLLDQAPALTRNPAGEGRLYIDYRLDGTFDHWLLDEFQDTSHAQWRVLRNLIDETVQADTPERTFFCVGDIKQAIYGWRGGDSALFGQVAEQYRLEPESLACSWRSSSVVLDAVNAVFGSVSQAEALDPLVRERWASVWQPHTAAQSALAGFAALYQVPKDETEGLDVWDCAARLVQALTMEKRGTVGVLVRSNAHGERMAEALDRCGVAAVWEGNSSVAATSQAAAFLALVRLAEHPGDRFAQRHVEMSPLNEKLKARELSSRTAGPVVLRQIWAGGFEAVLNAWLPEASGELRDAVRTFDTLNRRDIVGFIEFIENTQSSKMTLRSRVSVMTVHKAKGLEFDAVVVPDLEGRHALGTVMPEGLEVHRSGLEQAVEWILDFPPKAVAVADPVLNDHLRQAGVRNAMEELCVLYVAMTRARQGLVLLVEEPGKGAKAFYASRLVEQALATEEPQPVEINGAALRCLYRHGDPAWQPAAEPDPNPVTGVPVEWPEAVFQIPQRLDRLLPSDAGASDIDAGLLFNPEQRYALRRGAVLHALLERIEWLDDSAEPTSLFSGGEGRELMEEPARSILLDALRQPEVRAVFERPAEGPCEVWRERAFEVVLDGCWITGRFDRVVIFRDDAGRALRAELVDFKCGRKENQERYAPQITLYRRALARLLELPEERVEDRLVFVEPLPSGARR